MSDQKVLGEISDANSVAILDRAASGLGSPVLTLAALGELLQRAKLRNLGVVAIEVYLVEGEQQIPALEYGLYQDEISQITKNISESERPEFTILRANQLANELSAQKASYVVQVWLE